MNDPIQGLQTASEDEPYVVQYHEYDAQLPSVFTSLKRLIEAATGAASIEHVGSSSIPGVGGRNALDVAMAVAPEAQSRVRQALLDLGFDDAPFPHYLPLLVGQIGHQDRNHPILLMWWRPMRPFCGNGWRFAIICVFTRTRPATTMPQSALQSPTEKSSETIIRKPKLPSS